jgi:hypothetical protein
MFPIKIESEKEGCVTTSQPPPRHTAERRDPAGPRRVQGRGERDEPCAPGSDRLQTAEGGT